jgi:hypothetical protein
MDVGIIRAISFRFLNKQQTTKANVAIFLGCQRPGKPFKEVDYFPGLKKV